MFEAERERLLTALPPLPECTRLIGVIPMGSSINQLQVQLLQQYMARVVQQHSQAQSDTTADATTNHTTRQLFDPPTLQHPSMNTLEGSSLDQNGHDNTVDVAAGSASRPNPRLACFRTTYVWPDAMELAVLEFKGFLPVRFVGLLPT